MPSFLHEALLDILREHPGLVAELLRRTQAPALPEHDVVVVDSADLGAVIPRELAADCLLRFERGGQTILVVVLEVQLAVDLDKLYTWPAYLVGARLRHRCDGILVMITPDRKVADWARNPISIGPGAGYLHVHVIGPREMPAITDPAEAARAPELAVLSAVAHGHDADLSKTTAITLAALGAMFYLSDDRAQLYFDYVWAALGSAARKALNMLPQVRQQKMGIVSRAVMKAEAKAEARGETKGLTLGLLAVLEARGLSVSADQRARILECSEVGQLRGWIAAAATADAVVDVIRL